MLFLEDGDEDGGDESEQADDAAEPPDDESEQADDSPETLVEPDDSEPP